MKKKGYSLSVTYQGAHGFFRWRTANITIIARNKEYREFQDKLATELQKELEHYGWTFVSAVGDNEYTELVATVEDKDEYREFVDDYKRAKKFVLEKVA